MGKVYRKKGKKIALWNSIIWCTLFCIVLAIISNGETAITSFAPAVTYYFISKWILIDKTIPDEIKNEYDVEHLEGSDKILPVSQNTNIKTDKKIKYCFNCGCKLLKNSNYCPQCGKKQSNKGIQNENK